MDKIYALKDVIVVSDDGSHTDSYEIHDKDGEFTQLLEKYLPDVPYLEDIWLYYVPVMLAYKMDSLDRLKNLNYPLGKDVKYGQLLYNTFSDLPPHMIRKIFQIVKERTLYPPGYIFFYNLLFDINPSVPGVFPFGITYNSDEWNMWYTKREIALFMQDLIKDVWSKIESSDVLKIYKKQFIECSDFRELDQIKDKVLSLYSDYMMLELVGNKNSKRKYESYCSKNLNISEITNNSDVIISLTSTNYLTQSNFENFISSKSRLTYLSIEYNDDNYISICSDDLDSINVYKLVYVLKTGLNYEMINLKDSDDIMKIIKKFINGESLDEY